MTQPWEVLRNVPTGITDPSGRVTPLLDWHKGDALKTEPRCFLPAGAR
jgi:hypothetical protein